MLTKHTSFFLIIAAITLVVASPVHGQKKWTNGAANNKWTDPGNWKADSPPKKGDKVKINLSGEDKAVVGSEDHAKCYRVIVGNGNGVTGELAIRGGKLSARGRHGRMTIGANGGTGIVKQSGGHYGQKKKSVYIGDAKSSGTWKLSGGSFGISRGSINIRKNGLMDISGGSVGANGVHVKNGGRFRVVGAAANKMSFLSQGWKQAAGGVLDVRIGGGGVTAVNTGRADVTFQKGARLNAGFLDGDARVGSWDVMTWKGKLKDNGLMFADTVDKKIWNVHFVDTNDDGSPDTLSVNAVPNRPKRVSYVQNLFGDAPDRAVRSLLHVLKAEKLDDRLAAIETLKEMGTDAAPALSSRYAEPVVEVMVKHKSLLNESVEALIAAGVAQKYVPHLKHLLGAKDTDVQLAAVNALEKIGPGAADAAGLLVRLLDDNDVRPDVLDALIAIGPDAIPSLSQALRHELEEDTKMAVLDAIEHIQPEFTAVLSPLRKLIQDPPSAKMHRKAVRVLGRLDRRGEHAGALLLDALVDSKMDIVPLGTHFIMSVDERENVQIGIPRRSKPAEPGGVVEYPVVLRNTGEERTSVRLELEEEGRKMMRGTLEPNSLELRPGQAATAFVRVKLHNKAPRGKRREQTLRVFLDKANKTQKELTFITVSKLPRPNLVHTQQGWQGVKNKIDKYKWAQQIFDVVKRSADQWDYVPEPSSDYVFHRRFSTNGAPIQTTGVAYMLTGKKRYAGVIKRYLLTLSDPRDGYPVTGRASSHGDVKEGNIFYKAALLYEALHGSGVLSDAEHRQIRKTLLLFLKNTAEAYQDLSVSNHALSRVTGAIFCAFVLQDWHYVRRFLYGPSGFTDQVVNGVLDDGWYYETDTGYHMMVAGLLSQIAKAARPWGLRLFDHRIPVQERTLEGGRNRGGPDYRDDRSVKDLFDSRLPLADYRGVVFANNKSGDVNIRGKLELPYYLSGKPEYAWFLNKRDRGLTPEQIKRLGGKELGVSSGVLSSLLYGVPDLPNVKRYTRPNTVVCENAGLYVLRSPGRDGREEIQAVLKSGFRQAGREHQDDASLLSLMRYGRSFHHPRDWDGSKVPRRIWLRRTSSHNMVMVNQRYQSGQSGDKCLLHHSGDLFTGAAAETHVQWGDGLPVRQRRLLLVTDDYVIVADHVTVKEQRDKEHEFDWVIHPVGFQGLKAAEKKKLNIDRDIGLSNITNSDWYAVKTPALARFDQKFSDGHLKMDIRPLWPKQAKMAISDYPHTPRGQQRKTLSIRKTGNSALFWTVIEPYEDQPVIEKTGINSADGTLMIALKDGRVHKIQTNGFQQDQKAPDVNVKITETQNSKVLRSETGGPPPEEGPIAHPLRERMQSNR